MQKRSSKSDFAQNALKVVEISTGGTLSRRSPVEDMSKSAISEIMREMGRRGGLKGGKNRADTLTAERRRQIASDAARTRWHKEEEPKQ